MTVQRQKFHRELACMGVLGSDKSMCNFKALSTCVGVPSESTTLFKGLIHHVLANYICSAPEQMSRMTFLCFRLTLP